MRRVDEVRSGASSPRASSAASRSALAALVAVGVGSVAGCFSVTFQDGEISCATTRLCPDGFQCIDDVCRQPGPVDAAVDAPLTDAAPGLPANCAEHLAGGATASGVYSIDPDPPGDPIDVYCEMTIDGGGWTMLVNNDNADAEPEDCRPRLATTPALVCGVPGGGADFSTATDGIEFTDLLFAAYSADFEVESYRWFSWNETIAFPQTELWQLVPDDPDVQSAALADSPLIRCRYQVLGASGLRRVLNGNPRVDTGDYLDTDVITIFDQDLVDDNPGKLSFTDAVTGRGSLEGLDDFQDGNGCNDEWDPQEHRGFSTFIAVR